MDDDRPGDTGSRPGDALAPRSADDRGAQPVDPDAGTADLLRRTAELAIEHRAGLAALGLTPIHRLSFAPCRDREQMALWDDAAAGADVDADETGESGELPELELVD